MRNIFIFIFSTILIFSTYQAQVPYLSFGYTSASERNSDIESFGQHALSVNNDQTFNNKQQRKGFNVGLGMESADVEDGMNGYLRVGLNYAYFGGNTFSNSSSMKSSMNAYDANLAVGLGQGIGGGDMMVAFYGIIGGTYGFEKIKMTSLYSLSSKYTSHRMNLSYGLGLGLISTRGFGLCLDVLLALPPSSDKHNFNSESGDLPIDYDSYKILGTSYNGGYVGANWKWMRADIKIIIPLKSN